MVKQNWDSINELKKFTLDNYSNAKQTNNAIERRKNIELALKIEEDIANYLDVLKLINPSLPNLSISISDDKASIAPQLEDRRFHDSDSSHPVEHQSAHRHRHGLS